MPPPPWAKDGLMAGRADNMPPPDGRRFAALSTLPEDRRMPVRRNVPLAKHQRQEQSSVQPLGPDAQEIPPPASAAVLLPPTESRQLGFNCPACFAVLIIKDPATYDGSPAPCPTCGIRIQPPQCMPESPFSIVHRTQPVSLPLSHGFLG